jgi:hypothetical protein
MNNIGFNANVNAKKEALTLERVQKILQNEIVSCSQFEQTTLNELREIKDVEENLKLVIMQVNSINKLVETKQQLVKQLLEETGKISKDINIEFSKKHFEGIKHIDDELTNMLKIVEDELNRLKITETHHLYDESNASKKKMSEIDDKARKLHSEIKIMKDINNSFHENLHVTWNKLIKLETERSKRDVKTTKIGFQV